jgi:hypothetical protein
LQVAKDDGAPSGVKGEGLNNSPASMQYSTLKIRGKNIPAAAVLTCHKIESYALHKKEKGRFFDNAVFIGYTICVAGAMQGD